MLKPARRRKRQQFLVRTRIPQEEGKTGSQFQIGESKLGIGRCPLRPANRAVEKIRARQYRRHHLLDSLIEAPATTRPAS